MKNIFQSLKKLSFRHQVVLLGFGTVIFYVFLVYGSLAEEQIAMFINSDTLYFSSLFKDIFIDHSKEVIWHVPGATCFFPDFLIYLLYRFLTSNFIVAMFLSGLTLCLLLMVSYILLFNSFLEFPKYKIHIATGISFLILIFWASLIVGDFSFTFYLTTTNYHLGAFIGAVFCYYLSINYLKTQNYKSLVGFVLTMALTLSSDFLFVSYAYIPILSLIILVFNKTYRKRILLLVAGTTLSALLGFLVFRGLHLLPSLEILAIPEKTLNFSQVASSYKLMFAHHFRYIQLFDLRGIIFILSAISLLISFVLMIKMLVRFYRKKEEVTQQNFLELAYLLIITSGIIIIYNTPAINGAYVGWAIFRYNVYVLFISLLNYGYLSYKLHQSVAKKWGRLIPITCLGLVVVLGLFRLTKPSSSINISKVLHYYPQWVEVIDQYTKDNNVQYGISEYWYARTATMLSKNDARLYQVHYNLRPWHHVTNETWYYNTGRGNYSKPEFEFVILNNLREDIISKKLEGHILDTAKKGSFVIVKTQPFIFEQGSKNLIFDAK